MMELFKDVVASAMQHQHYRSISSSPLYKDERKLLQQWTDGFHDRDGKFVKEFQTSFNSSFWELYLYQCFKSLHFDIDFSHQSPDFIINSEISSFTAEATIASNPTGFQEEREADLKKIPKTAQEFEKLLYLACIRIANSFTSKCNRYKEYYQNLSHVSGKPFVICIAPFEQPFAFIQNDVAVRRVLYNFNEPLYFDTAEGERIFTGISEFPVVLKESGAEIKLGFFTDQRFSDISAVIFSSTATWAKIRALSKCCGQHIFFFAKRYNSLNKYPYIMMEKKENYFETLLDGLHVYINPFAKYRLNIEQFKNSEIALHYYLPKEKHFLDEVPHGFLISHGCITITTGQGSRIEKIKASCKKRIASESFELPEWPDGELVYVGGISGPFTDNHLSHYKGYTILVGRDTIDNDWCTQALPGKYYNTAWYYKASKESDSKGLIYPHDSYSSKERALENMKLLIDQLLNELPKIK